MLSYTTLLLLSSFLLSYGICIAIFRLIFHPLAHFPGPKLAALTFAYEGWYDAILGGQYNKQVRLMHDKYGPIVRISPAEVHILDPDFYDSIYIAGNRRVNKWDRQMCGFSCDKASFGTLDHHLHQARRAPLGISFSKRAVNQLEPVITKYINKLLTRLAKSKGNSHPVNLIYAYSALTGDIINEYSFGKSQNYLESPNLSADWYELAMSTNSLHHLFKHIGGPDAWFALLPSWLSARFYPVQIVNLQAHLRAQLTHVQESKDSGSAQQRTVFHEIFDSDLPPHEKAVDRLIDESFSVTAAGTITTADTLAVISYHLLSQPAALARLRDELRSHPSETLQQLEQLPYLTAIIKEGLRLACGVTSRLARIFPDTVLQYKEWNIPPDTPVSMSCELVHYHPGVFPNPHAFEPERWLGGPKDEGQRLEKYLVAFSKGPRQCVGMNLAYAEMYLTLARVFGEGGPALELFETGDEDVEIESDSFVPGFRKASKGIRVVVK